MPDGEFPHWYQRIADQFVPKNRCVYCWWVRGGLAHALAWDILVGNLLVIVWPELAWWLRGAALAGLVVIWRYDTFVESSDDDGESSEKEKREKPDSDGG